MLEGGESMNPNDAMIYLILSLPHMCNYVKLSPFFLFLLIFMLLKFYLLKH